MKTSKTTNVPRSKLPLTAIREGFRDLREGRNESHEKTARWPRSWGKETRAAPRHDLLP